MRKNFYNLNITVRGILLFCDKMPDKKTEIPTEILSWKKSLEIMAKDAINKLLLASIKKGLIKNEKDLTMTFVRNKDFGKNCSVTHFYCQMFMGKKISSIPLFE